MTVTIGQMLKGARIQRGISVERMAALLNVNVSAIYAIERGEYTPSATKIRNYTGALDVSDDVPIAWWAGPYYFETNSQASLFARVVRTPIVPVQTHPDTTWRRQPVPINDHDSKWGDRPYPPFKRNVRKHTNRASSHLTVDWGSSAVKHLVYNYTPLKGRDKPREQSQRLKEAIATFRELGIPLPEPFASAPDATPPVSGPPSLASGPPSLASGPPSLADELRARLAATGQADPTPPDPPPTLPEPTSAEQSGIPPWARTPVPSTQAPEVPSWAAADAQPATLEAWARSTDDGDTPNR